jgi:hypothetical protein
LGIVVVTDGFAGEGATEITGREFGFVGTDVGGAGLGPDLPADPLPFLDRGSAFCLAGAGNSRSLDTFPAGCSTSLISDASWNERLAAS